MILQGGTCLIWVDTYTVLGLSGLLPRLLQYGCARHQWTEWNSTWSNRIDLSGLEENTPRCFAGT